MRFLLILLLVTFSNLTHAELFLEPYGAFNFGKIGEEGDTHSGVGYGGRLGYINTGFHFGVDYSQSTLSVNDDTKDDDNDDDVVDPDDGERMSDSKLSLKEYAAFVGLNFPAFIRVYGGYIFSAQGNIPKAKYEFSEGKGSKFGLSFTSIPFVNINFEYRNIKFGKVEDGDSDEKDATDRTGGNFEAYAITLSIPISI
jgi:hypothetical protein